MKVTRDVVADLWPLYADGTASADTGALVEEYLRQDPEWSATLSRAAGAPIADLAPPTIQPDQETHVLNQIKRRLRRIHMLLMFAMIFTMFSVGRVIADTTWTASPRNFIVTATIAGVFWAAYLTALFRIRGVGP